MANEHLSFYFFFLLFVLGFFVLLLKSLSDARKGKSSAESMNSRSCLPASDFNTLK